MPINKLKTNSIETDAITADLLATGSVTVADIPDAEITDAKLHTNLDFTTKTFTMHTNHVTHAMVTQHQAQLAIGADQIDSGSPTFGGDVTITGNLTVNGTTTTLNTETLTVDDNIIVLNNNEAGTPSQNAGIEVERGTSTNVSLRWNETTDKWQFTNDGTTYTDIGAGGDVVDDTTPQLGGTLDANGNSIDMDGNELILDADADTSITADTDDQIDFKIGGTDAMTVAHSSTGYTTKTIMSTNDDSYVSPALRLYKNSSSPANWDYGATLQFQQNDSAGNQTTYAQIIGRTVNPSNGSEEGSLMFYVAKSGSSQINTILYDSRVEFHRNQDLQWWQHTGTYDFNLHTPNTITADRNIYFPDANGTVPVFTTAPTGAIADGSSGQVLTTDGNGGLSFTTVSGGGATSAYAKFTYEIAATVNSVSGNDTNGNTLSYSAGNNVVEVFVNGVKQQEGSGKDYQATTGNSVVFTNNLYSGDLVDVVAYNMFSAGNINIDGSGNLAIGNDIIFEGATANAFETTLTVTDPTADRTITLPDNTGNIAVQTSDGYLQVYGDYGTSSDQVGINLNSGGSSRANLRIGPNSTSFSWDHWHFEVDPDDTMSYSSCKFRVDGDDYIRIGPNMTSEISEMVAIYKPMYIYTVGTSPNFVFEGATANSFETTLAVTDPTADRAITLPDLSGTILVNENLGGDPANDNGNLIISHGATGQPMASITSTALNNIAIGNQNLTALTEGDNNTVIGKLVLDAETTGTGNIVVGQGSLGVGAGHSYNTVMGQLNTATHNSSSGQQYNTFIGVGAGQWTASGDYNTQIGGYARSYYSNTSYGTAIGYDSRHNHSYGVSVGYRTGSSMYGQSDYGVLIGSYAGYDMDGGDQCTFVGYAAGYSGGSGGYNTGIGMDCLRDLTSGQHNAACGRGAGRNIESGSNNTFLGNNSGFDLTTGSNNVFVGYAASQTGSNDLVSGSNNIIIGANAQSTSDSMSNTIVLGDANITSFTCNVQSISALSDERDKTDIQDLTLGLDFIKAMRPVQFTWNRRDGTLGTRKEVGFVAQELQEVEMDFNSKNRTHMVNDDDPSKLLAAPMQSYPILIKAIQELSAKVDSLQAEVNTLKNGG